MNRVDAKAAGARCDICPNSKGQLVASTTPSGRVSLVIVGEHPTRVDEKMNAPFSGAPGHFLDDRLRRDAKLSRNSAHITNAALCRGDSDDDNERAAECCAPRLLKEIAELPADTPVVALGKSALRSLLGVRNILMARGFIWTVAEIEESRVKAAFKSKQDGILKGDTLRARQLLASRVVLPSIAPSFVLRADVYKPISELDFRRIGRVVRGEVCAPLEDECAYQVGGPEVLQSLGSSVSLDVETDALSQHLSNLLCVGLSDGVNTSVIWPWHPEMAAPLQAFLEGRAEVVCHNGPYDQQVLERHGVALEGIRWEDTMTGHHAYASHFKMSLENVASCWTDARAWKQIFKGGDENEKGTTPDKLDAETLVKYNAADARLTALSWQRMQSSLLPERVVYESDRQLTDICRGMGKLGIGVDSVRAKELSTALGNRCAELKSILRELVGDPNYEPGSHPQTRRHLFQTLGATYAKVTKKGKPSTADETLEGLRLGGNELHAQFATALLEFRVAGKVKSTYIDVLGAPGKKGVPLIGGRAKFGWKALTVSGRLNCRFQSVPRYTPLGVKGPAEERVREIYIPAEGNQFVYYDVSQAEMRLAAFLSGDANFIEACNGDVHANNAKAVFPDAAAKGWLDGEMKKKEGKPFRDICKNLGFAISYCAEAETVFMNLRSKGFNVTMAAVTLILDRLRNAYKVYFKWVESNLQTVRLRGHLRSAFLGRIRWLGWYPKITDVANFPIQAGLADIMNERTIQLASSFLGGKLVAQVHDACIYDVPKACVSEAKDLISKCWANEIDTPGGKLILPIDLKTGERVSDL